jgi:hypothetical protein
MPPASTKEIKDWISSTPMLTVVFSRSEEQEGFGNKLDLAVRSKLTTAGYLLPPDSTRVALYGKMPGQAFFTTIETADDLAAFAYVKSETFNTAGQPLIAHIMITRDFNFSHVPVRLAPAGHEHTEYVVHAEAAAMDEAVEAGEDAAEATAEATAEVATP